MAFSSSTDHVDHVATQSSSVTSTSKEKVGIPLVGKPDISLNVKPGVKVEVNELSSGPPQPPMQNYVRSFRELFTVKTMLRCGAVLAKFGKFTGPGTIISVAYIDPDNYQTAVSSGAEFHFKLLFIILISNLIAIYLQVSIFPI
jgi:metal iron transporter